MVGGYKAILDDKGRMNIPTKLREELGEKFYISKTIGAPCIKVYTAASWQERVDKIKALPATKTADIQRFLFGSAYETAMDKAGRILIPEQLREYAGLSGESYIVGLYGDAEIWDRAKWEEMNSARDDEKLAQMAMELDL